MLARYSLLVAASIVTTAASAQTVGVAWAKGDSFGGNTSPTHCVALKNGNFAVLSTVTRSGRTDGILSCYRNDGSTVWVKTLWGTDIFRPAGLFVGSTGDIFVAAAAGPAGGAQAYAARIAPAGNTFWAQRFKLSAGAREDSITDAAFDIPNNTLHMTGQARRLTGLAYDQPVYLKVNSNGTKGLSVFSSSIAAESSGLSIRANGASRVAIGIQSAAGASRIWVLNSTTGTIFDKAVPIVKDIAAVELNSASEVYLGGRYYNTASDSAPAVQKLSAAGTLLWTRWVNFDFSGNALDTITKIRVDASGNVWAAGTANYNALDFVLMKIAPGGNVLATKLNNSSVPTSNDTATFLELGPQSDIYVAGSMVNPTNEGFLAMRANTNATFRWERWVPGSGTLEYAFKNACLNPITGQLLLAHHEAAESRMVLYCLSQPALPQNDSYSISRNTTLNGTTVFANDTYATDGIAVPVQMPSHGTLTMNANGTFLYMPNSGYVGIDNFTYKITKTGVSDSPAVQVVINVT